MLFLIDHGSEQSRARRKFSFAVMTVLLAHLWREVGGGRYEFDNNPGNIKATLSWRGLAAYRTNVVDGRQPYRAYTSITLRSSINGTGRTCTGAAANTLCQAIRTAHGAATISVACGGFTWSVGQCYAGQVEVNADGTFCSCSSSWAARPCHQDPNFGGVGIGSCGAANQEIVVNCQ